MKADSKFRINIIKILIITFCYMFIGLLFAISNHIDITSHYSIGPSKDYNIQVNFFSNIIGGFFGGIIGGYVLVFIIGEKFKKKPFLYSILFTGGLYAMVYILISTSIFCYVCANKLQKPLYEFEVISLVIKNLIAPSNLLNFFQWGIIFSATQFMLQVNDKFGQGILIDFILGRYHRPRKEQRIFMFLDIKSSTAIAEKIGHRKYFNLLSDFFSDITNSIISTKGEIYQYVGDEIVVSWSLDNGINNANCLHCFFKIQNVIKELSIEYDSKYGVVPNFKAGLHYGEVTAGEIGVIKKDIIYSGDVLNTTSRIQEQCNIYEVNILVSKPILDLMDERYSFKATPIAEIQLRGRNEKIELNTLKIN